MLHILEGAQILSSLKQKHSSSRGKWEDNSPDEACEAFWANIGTILVSLKHRTDAECGSERTATKMLLRGQTFVVCEGDRLDHLEKKD